MFKNKKYKISLLLCSFFTLQNAFFFGAHQAWASAVEPRNTTTKYSIDEALFPALVTNNSHSNWQSPGPSVKQLISTYNSSNSSSTLFGFPGGSSSSGSIFDSSSNYSNEQTASEFACPLFENNPYESVFKALDELRRGAQIIPACGGGHSSSTANSEIVNNSDALRASLLGLRAMQTDPTQMASQDQIETNIRQALGAVQNISRNLESNPMINSQCGKATAGKTLLAFNEIVNSLAPIALVSAAMFPAIGVATQMALVGASMAPSAISQTAQFIKNNTADVSQPEVRKAILQSTCQYMKIYKKIYYMRLKSDSNLNEIRANIEQSTQKYRQKYQNASSDLFEAMQYKFDSEKKINQLELLLAADRQKLRELNLKLNSLGADDEGICYTGRNLLQLSMNGEGFPASVSRNIEGFLAVLQSNNSGSNNQSFQLPAINLDQENTSTNSQNPQVLEAFTLYNSTNKAKSRVAAFVEKMISGSLEESDRAIPLCAKEVKTWAKRIGESVNFLSSSLNSERKEIDQILSQSADFNNWNRDYLKLKSERKTVSTVTKVLREMAQPDAVFVRAELFSQANAFKNTLFNRTAGALSRAPVEAWLMTHIDQHQNAVSRFMFQLRILQQESAQLLINKTLAARPASASPLAMFIAPAQWNTTATQTDLNGLNLKMIPFKSKNHEMACQQIQIALLQYDQAKDFLGTAQFMCDMIDPIMTDTSPAIIQICRGSANFTQNIRSTIEQNRFRLVSKGPNNSLRSVVDSVNLLKSKNTALKCNLVL